MNESPLESLIKKDKSEMMDMTTEELTNHVRKMHEFAMSPIVLRAAMNVTGEEEEEKEIDSLSEFLGD